MKQITRLLATAALGLAAAAPAHAITYTITGSTPNASAVSAEADITLGNGFIDIALTNTLTGGIPGVGAAVSGISFNVTGLTSTGAVSFIAGTEGNVSRSGAWSTLCTSGCPTWYTDGSGGGFVNLSIFNHGTPHYALLPVQANYASANGSIKGNVHNPFYKGDLEFEILAAGITSKSRISNVQFMFGTGPDTLNAVVPEPGTYALLAAGLVLVALSSRRRLPA